MAKQQMEQLFTEFIETKNKSNISITATGFQAVARGAYEAGVTLWAGFPGVPSNQLVEAYKSLCEGENGIKRIVEFATNDKVALETALGGSMCNARSVVSMTHQGLNIAADSFMTACYAGALGGMVVITVDDPGIQFSQSEVDNRYYGLHGIIPIFEPATIQEAKDLMKFAFKFSEEYETLVLFRMSSELNFSQGTLLLGDKEPPRTQFQFDEAQRMRWTHLPTNARVNRVKLLDRLKKITTYSDSFPFNKFTIHENAKIGIITSNTISRKIEELYGESPQNKMISICHIAMTYPLPKGKLQEFINAHEKLIVIEELEPILESAIKSIAYDIGYTGEIKGRTLFSRTGPITAEKIQQVIKEHYKMESEIKPSEKRTTLTHSECSNTTNFILSRIYELKKKSPTSFILGTDLGCEIFSTQTAKNPLEISLSVGATMGIVNGIVKLDNRVPVTICSHEMFLHSGVSALINAVYNENPQIAIIIEENSPEIQKNQQMYKLDYNNFRMSIGIPDQNYFQLSFEALEKNPKQFDDVFFEVLKLNNVRIIHIAHNPKGGH